MWAKGQVLLKRLREQDGLELIEIIVATFIALVVIGAAVTSYVSQLNSQTLSVSRANSAHEVIPGLERMTRDIRSATSAQIVGTNQIDLRAPMRNGAATSVSRRVVYTCASGRCTRDEGPADGAVSGNPIVAINRVRNTDVFSPANVTYTGGTVNSSPYVAIKLNVEISETTGRIVQYNDGITLRNVPTS